MARTTRVTELQLRKKALLLESHLNRQALRAECARLSGAMDWVGRIREMGQKIGPWAVVLAPLAGLAMALGLRRSKPVTGLLASALGVVPSLIKIWHAVSPPSNEPK